MAQWERGLFPEQRQVLGRTNYSTNINNQLAFLIINQDLSTTDEDRNF